MFDHYSHKIRRLGKSMIFPESEPGTLEKFGVKYYHFLGKSFGTSALPDVSIDQLPNDTTLQTIASNITHLAVIIAFGVGALTTLVTVWIETQYHDLLPPVDYYLLYGGSILVMLVVELIILYWLGLKTVYSLACLIGYNNNNDDETLLPLHHSLPNILARAALELPDPVIRYLGIDPLKHLSKKRMLFFALLYKLKVIFSSMLVRYLLIRFAGKGGSRTAFNWIAIPVTGLWDAYTLYKVAREARLRLFGHKLADYLITCVITDELLSKLSWQARECAVRAIAAIIVLAQNYHPNLIILLVRFSNSLEIKEEKNYDSWEELIALINSLSDHERLFVLDILSVAVAFDGKLSQLELRHLPEAFGELNEFYLYRIRQLIKMLDSGRMHAAKRLCTLGYWRLKQQIHFYIDKHIR